MAQQTSSVPKPRDEGSTISTNFAMMARIRGDFSTEQLQEALARVRTRHRALVVDPREPSESFLLPDNVHRFPLRVLTGCGETDWITVAKTELCQNVWDESGPFARFVLLRSKGYSDIVCVFNHSICDGISGVYFIRDMLRLLGEPNVELPPIPTPPNAFTLIPASVAQDQRVKRQAGVIITMLRASILLQRLSKRLFPKAKKAAPNRRTPEGDIPADQRFCILPVSLTSQQTQALVTRCRVEQTSVHAAICTAWLRAFANTLKGRKSWLRSASSPVNLRDRLARPVGETSGMFMSSAETRVNCAPGRGFWQVAREFKQKLKSGSTDDKVFMMPMIFAAVFSRLSEADRWEFAEHFFDQPTKHDFFITNIGRLDIPARNGSLDVDAFYGPLVNSSKHERTVGVNTFGDKLTFSYVFRESKMDPAQAEMLMRQAIEQLAMAVDW